MVTRVRSEPLFVLKSLHCKNGGHGSFFGDGVHHRELDTGFACCDATATAYICPALLFALAICFGEGAFFPRHCSVALASDWSFAGKALLLTASG